ncbi:ATP-grasp ribosomal peptide maturase [Streptomyces sp. AC536]|uniref:ATP-grasp ribosomal peptide maturase n=1 Tax=Streptomyces buecherae TaxID=2763006 RepID=UPI00164D18E7|nr:ATP-grasp ribosomal peptide maturase [Streptomyces buecherae]MBC3982857.1 ATP-grasp ribosomal peptide maturase [Streptomyces buecherae]QNJ41511.1 ATP-grasp ribosomal peptide maturase [Streptomyces buecherae]
MAATEPRPVLVATEAADVTADMVIDRLNQRGVPVVRFDPADMAGGELTVTARFGAGDAPVTGWLRTPSRRVALENARSVYWRRPVWPAYEHLDDADARFAAAQTRFGLGGVLHALQGCLWLNHPLRNLAADYKPHQLAAARRMGLTIAPTVVTNDPDVAREFIEAHGQVVYKTLRWTPYERDGTAMTSWADLVSADEVDESIRAAPHLFQARVDKQADVRVLVVGRRVFAVRIDSDLLDWRRDYSALSYRVIDLPVTLSEALLAYLEHFGLPSGSFDMALGRDGAFHWLELNPNGQWGFLEEGTGLDMAGAFADLLVQGERDDPV